MALKIKVVSALLFAVALAQIKLSHSYVVSGKISCLDCKNDYDLSGIKVLVKCDKVKQSTMAKTEETGFFMAQLPSDTPLNCLAKVLGGPRQLYASKDNMVSKIVETQYPNSYTTLTPILISTTCPSSADNDKICGEHNMVGSSKTVDLPLPKEWGLAPTSYYVPFMPIIGIP